MFYSQCLVSKKGVLGTIWVAAHCLKRLKKHQVYHTNISSSVDKILVDEVPVVTHRVLAFLLLGVVKIYSLKVEYLYDDCNRIVDKINDFSGIKKKASKVIEGMRAPCLSITRPKKLELDTFDLQILEDGNGNGDNGKAAEDITLEDVCHNEEARYHSPEKIHHEDRVSHPEPCSTAQHTPVQDVFSPYIIMEKELYTEEKNVGSSSINIINSEPSIENIRKNNFPLDDRLDPMILGEIEGEKGLFAPIFENDGEHAKSSEKQDDELTVPMSVDVTLGSNCPPDSELPESKKRQPSTQDCHAPMSVDVTFPSKGPNDSVITPELIPVKTPVIRERGSSSRKRKCLFDEAVVLSNKVVKDNLKDTSDLVCKRQKAPLTTLHAWKRHQISNLPRTFSEPLFPCSSSDIRSLFLVTKLKSTEMEKEKGKENAEPPEKLIVPESPAMNKSPDEAHISPSTPDTESASLRTNGDVSFFTPVIESDSFRTNGNAETTEFHKEGLISTFERTDTEELSQSEEEESENCLNSEEINSQGVVNQETGEWSDRTRLIATQLCRSLLSRKKRGQNKKGKSLLQALKKKTKNESAVFFYETLVLKTTGYIEVEQNEAYSDIVLIETVKLKQACQTGKFNFS